MLSEDVLKWILIIGIVQIILLLILISNSRGHEGFEDSTIKNPTCEPNGCADKLCVPYNKYVDAAYGTCRPAKGSSCWFDSDCSIKEACWQRYDEGLFHVPGKCEELSYKWKPLYAKYGGLQFSPTNYDPSPP